MKFVLILLAFFLINIEVSAQIGGLSASKLNSVCVDVVKYHVIEFEPSFYYSNSSKYWNNDNRLSNTFNTSDSISNSAGMQFRFTYGLLNRLEVGVTVPYDLSMSSWGLRYIVSQNNKLGFALMSGVNVPLGNNIQDRSIKTEENTSQFGFGAVLSYQENSNFSIDFNAQFNSYLKKLKSTENNSLYLSAEAGYFFFSHSFQIIGGVGYQNHYYDADNKFLVTLYPGMSIETGKDFIIVLQAPFDIYGKNIGKTVGFGFALTLII
ncbi:MAG: hypothetical protein DRJ01_04480 [Bacteroidetes bacterium]|nr:MAG: hypothetical protein DRJ01_04480 [Bacteroidota bacterium]